MICSLAACSGKSDGGGDDSGDGNEAVFHILGTDGQWAVCEEGPELPEDEVTLEADAEGNDLLKKGDYVKASGWKSKKDGTGDDYADGASGNWYAKYDVTGYTVWFSTEIGAAVEDDRADDGTEWKVAMPGDPSLEHFVFKSRVWCSDEALTQPFDFENTTMTHSMTLYAKDEWETPLCFTALADGCSVALSATGAPGGIALRTSADGGVTWADYTPGDRIDLAKGDSVYFIAAGEGGKNAKFSSGEGDYYSFGFGGSPDGKVAASGNVMSLLDDSLALDDLASAGDHVFYSLFRNCKALASAPDLPATTLVDNCYMYMFAGCASLASAPGELSAGTLVNSCYASMFEGCASLTASPVISATQGADYSCVSMFRGCTSLREVTVKLPHIGNGPTTMWMLDVPEGSGGDRVFHCLESLHSETESVTGGSASTIPNGWKVVNDIT